MQDFRTMTYPEIEHWYQTDFSEAFAENERKPFADIIRLIKEDKYDMWGLFENNILLGYATLWKNNNIPLVLLDYLGVNKDIRSQGIGSQILRHLKSLSYPIVTESELPVEGDSPAENEVRMRRMAFYSRNGFVPIYQMATCGMRWQAFVVNAERLTTDQTMEWHRALYGPARKDVKIPLSDGEKPELPYWMIK